MIGNCRTALYLEVAGREDSTIIHATVGSVKSMLHELQMLRCALGDFITYHNDPNVGMQELVERARIAMNISRSLDK